MSTAEIQLVMRVGTAADWTSADPTMDSGEIGYESDTGFWKWGDGATAWTSLTYDHRFGGVLEVAGDILMNEAADHTSTPVAGKGIFWVRDDGTPMFTDGAAVDTELDFTGTPFLLMGA